MRKPLKRTAYASSRHALVSRRVALRYGLASGAGLVLVACGQNDPVLRNVAIDIDPTTSAAPATETTTPVAAPTTATASTTTEAAPPETTTTTPTTPQVLNAVPDGSDLVVGFTYQQGAGGKNESPYTAVWVEDGDGALVHTIALWRQQNQKGLKYLPDLTRWFSADQSRVAIEGGSAADVVSGPTRLPGQYSVAWNGDTGTGLPVPPGDYFVCVESAREDGPHSLIRELVTLTGASLSVSLPDDGELVAASVTIA